MADQAQAVVDEIVETYLREGGAEYFGEAVTQLEHALQCADLAARSGASGLAFEVRRASGLPR